MIYGQIIRFRSMGSCEHDISFSLAAVDNFIDLQYGEGPLDLIKQEVSSFLLMTETLCLNYRPSCKFNFYLPHQKPKAIDVFSHRQRRQLLKFH